MFSGIVEEYATLVALVKDQENIHFTFKCSFVNELKIDQSISHNGVCLTVVTLTDDTYTVTAMKETLERSNLGLLKVGDKVNVERSMMMNGRLDGHIVQGHVDQTATCIDIKDAEGSWYFTFQYAFDKEMAKRGYITVDKGSVTVNGVSLTVCNPTDATFQVAIIPYTYEHTNFHTFEIGSVVNIEFDIIGSWYFTFQYAFDKEMAKRGYITVDKGSVTVNGVSLTVCNPTDATFQVAIIPYTYEHTNFHTFEIGSVVNIEFDIIGKYISRMIQYK